MKLKNTIYTDQTGKFRVRSLSGKLYIFLTYCYDSNAILVRLLSSKLGPELVEKLEEIYEYLTQRRYKPNHQILDNETSNLMKNFLKKHNVTF